jgi:hypothetical protein
MSIWSSVMTHDVGGRECRASNYFADSTDTYAGTGAEDLCIDVATATPWHGAIRFSIYAKAGFDVGVLLSPEAADTLIAMLTVARKRAAA